MIKRKAPKPPRNDPGQNQIEICENKFYKTPYHAYENVPLTLCLKNTSSQIIIYDNIPESHYTEIDDDGIYHNPQSKVSHFTPPTLPPRPNNLPRISRRKRFDWRMWKNSLGQKLAIYIYRKSV